MGRKIMKLKPVKVPEPPKAAPTKPPDTRRQVTLTNAEQLRPKPVDLTGIQNQIDTLSKSLMFGMSNIVDALKSSNGKEAAQPGPTNVHIDMKALQASLDANTAAMKSVEKALMADKDFKFEDGKAVGLKVRKRD